jgi:hypothetical protein
MLDAWVIIDESTPNLREETLEKLKFHMSRARLEAVNGGR